VHPQNIGLDYLYFNCVFAGAQSECVAIDTRTIEIADASGRILRYLLRECR
jgi:hypothetical protein